MSRSVEDNSSRKLLSPVQNITLFISMVTIAMIGVLIVSALRDAPQNAGSACVPGEVCTTEF